VLIKYRKAKQKVMGKAGTRRGIAFLGSDTGLRSFRRRSGEWKDCDILLILVSDAVRSAPIGLDFRSVDEFVPRGYYKQILGEFGDLATAWCQYEPLGKAFRLGDVDLGPFSRFALLANVVSKALIPMLAVREAIAHFQPDIVLSDTAMQVAVIAAGWPNPELLGHRRKITRWRPTALAACLSLLSLIHRFGVRVIGGKLASRLQRRAIGDGTVFIGDEQGFKSFELVLKEAVDSGHAVNLLKPLSLGVARTNLQLLDGVQRSYFEAQLSWRDTLRAFFASSRALLAFIYGIGSGRLAESYGPNRRVLFSLLQRELIRYVAFNAPLAFIGHLSAHRLVNHHRISKVVLSPAGSWAYTAALKAFRAHGIQTCAYTHGLIQEPLPYLSDADISISLGPFDAALLRSLLPNQDCTYTSSARRSDTAAGAPKDQIVILPTRWNPIEEGRFLRICLEFCRRRREKLDVARIVIKLHPHKASRSAQEAVDVADLGSRVIITQDDLREHLRRARLALCMSSTVVLDCLSLNIPFFLYDCPLQCPEGTLNGCLDEIVRFRSVEDLERKLPSRMAATEFNRLWRERYFGGEVPTCNPVNLLFESEGSAAVPDAREPEIA
jgi:hypothetical protein